VEAKFDSRKVPALVKELATTNKKLANFVPTWSDSRHQRVHETLFKEGGGERES
jgi:hypothetical protein